MRTALLAALAALSWVPSATAECRSSPAGAYSFDVGVSPGAGCTCLMIVRVFSGATCDPEALAWSDDFGCNLTDRAMVTDRGNFVSILAPATAHRDWSIVAVHAPRAGRIEGVWLSLDEIPGTEALRGVVRPVIEGAAIRFAEGVLVPFTTLEDVAAAPDESGAARAPGSRHAVPGRLGLRRYG